MLSRVMIPLALFAAICGTGCASKYSSKVQFNPTEPLRVAVLPFVRVDDKGEIMEVDDDLAVDNVPLVSQKYEENPAKTVRKAVLNELSTTGLDIVSPGLIDVDLPHRGFANADGSLDLARVWRTDPKEICTKFLTCDAVLYGKVTKWDRSYYAVQSVSTVGLDLRLVSARDGSELFSASAEDSDSRGISKIPTGFSDLVIEPIKGLDSEIISDLSRSVVKRMLQPLAAERKARYLQSAPPSIYASSHDATAPVLSRKQPLVVVTFGTPRQDASFSIGKSVLHQPMIERTRGHYYGEYYPLPSDTFAEAPVTVYLTDGFGRTTEQLIPRTTVTLLR